MPPFLKFPIIVSPEVYLLVISLPAVLPMVYSHGFSLHNALTFPSSHFYFQDSQGETAVGQKVKGLCDPPTFFCYRNTKAIMKSHFQKGKMHSFLELYVFLNLFSAIYFLKQQSKKPSKSKIVVGLFDDDDDDDIFGSPSNVPPAAKTEKAAVASKTTPVDEKEAEESAGKSTEKKNETSTVKSKSKKSRSFIDDDVGLFGDDQDDLFTAPSKVC